MAIYNQRHLIKCMRALNYPVDEKGMCFGLAQMAMQANLCHEQPRFIDRLLRLCDIKPENLSNVLNQDKDFALEVFAFFDGVCLYQEPTKYLAQLKPAGHSLPRQLATPARALVQAISFDSDQISTIWQTSNTFKPQELAPFLKQLHSNCGEHTFSLMLISGSHAIQLSFNPNTNQWFFFDANHLSGELIEQSDAGLIQLAEHIKRGFACQQTILFSTKLLCTQKNAPLLGRNIANFIETPFWQNLSAQRAPRLYYPDDNHFQLPLLLARSNDLACIKQLCLSLDKVAFVKFISVNVVNKMSPLSYACENNHTELSLSLIELTCQHKVFLSQLYAHRAAKLYLFWESCQAGNSIAAMALLAAMQAAQLSIGRILLNPPHYEFNALQKALLLEHHSLFYSLCENLVAYYEKAPNKHHGYRGALWQTLAVALINNEKTAADFLLGQLKHCAKLAKANQAENNEWLGAFKLAIDYNSKRALSALLSATVDCGINPFTDIFSQGLIAIALEKNKAELANDLLDYLISHKQVKPNYLPNKLAKATRLKIAGYLLAKNEGLKHWPQNDKYLYAKCTHPNVFPLHFVLKHQVLIENLLFAISLALVVSLSLLTAGITPATLAIAYGAGASMVGSGIKFFFY